MDYAKPLSQFADIAIMYYLADALPILRAMSRPQLRRLAKECSSLSEKYPLHLLGTSKVFNLKNWPKPESTSCYVLALMVGSLWVLQGENSDNLPDSYMKFWPIKDALTLCPMPLPVEEINRRGRKSSQPTKPKYKIKHLPEPVTGRKYTIRNRG